MVVLPRLQEFIEGMLDLVLVSPCRLCGRSAPAIICSDCERQLHDCRSSNPAQAWTGSLPVFTWGTYDTLLKRAIAALKYQNQPRLAQPLGQWLGQAWQENPISRIAPHLVVVPIPLHSDRQSQRGFNQAELIAKAFCQMTGLPLWPQGLVRTRATQAQYTLSPEDREQNLSAAFQVGSQYRQRPQRAVLLLDDIYTTGSTARAAAQALRRKGIRVYGLVAVAQPKYTQATDRVPSPSWRARKSGDQKSERG